MLLSIDIFFWLIHDLMGYNLWNTSYNYRNDVKDGDGATRIDGLTILLILSSLLGPLVNVQAFVTFWPRIFKCSSLEKTLSEYVNRYLQNLTFYIEVFFYYFFLLFKHSDSLFLVRGDFFRFFCLKCVLVAGCKVVFKSRPRIMFNTFLALPHNLPGLWCDKILLVFVLVIKLVNRLK